MTIFNPKASRIEVDFEKNKIADQIIQLTMDDDITDIPDELIAKTNGKALRNRHYFVLMDGGDDSVMVSAGSVLRYDTTDQLDERTGLINAILPVDCNEIAEQTFAFDTEKTYEQAAKILYAAGFQFSEKLQNEYEPKLTDRIKEALGMKPPAQEPPKPAKKSNPGNGGCMGNGGFSGFGNRGPF